MENIFENAKFGDKFVLDKPFDGELPYIIYLGKRIIPFGENDGELAYDFAGQTLEGEYTEIVADKDGKVYDEENRNIISHWEEKISEEKIGKIAEDSWNNLRKFASAKHVEDSLNNYVRGFIAGYNKAKEN